MDVEQAQNSPYMIHQGEGSLRANDEEDPEANDVYLEDIPPWTPLEIAVTGFAGITMIIAIITLAISANPLVLVTGILALLVPPFSAYQQQKITDIKAMQETNAAMERELTNLKYENERLSGENDRLDESVSNLQDLSVVFEEIREMEDASLDILEEQLVQSKEILDQMEDNKLNMVLGNIFDIVDASDKDFDSKLSDNEIDMLIKQIEGINSVEINDNLARKLIIDAGRGTDAVMKLIKNILDDDPLTGPQDTEKIITFL